MMLTHELSLVSNLCQHKRFANQKVLHLSDEVRAIHCDQPFEELRFG